MVATCKGKVPMIGDSKTTNISELTGMVSLPDGRTNHAFFNPGRDDAMKLMHRRTCRTAMSTLRRMCETKAADGLEKLSSISDTGNVCEACVEGKAVSEPHRSRDKKTTQVCKPMHTDIVGPIEPFGMDGEKYMQVLVDDYSGTIFVSTMSSRDGAGDATKKMVLHAQKLSGKKVVTVRPDGAKELKLGASKRFLDENGTIIEDIPPYSPECNGRAERSNWTIFDKARIIVA